ncbi:MAG: HU family DNA-binding protein [Alphaproteobacteria bacterium]
MIGARAAKIGVPRQPAKLAVDGLLSVVTEALERNEAVRLIGFGTFTTTRRPAGAVRNPRTG